MHIHSILSHARYSTRHLPSSGAFFLLLPSSTPPSLLPSLLHAIDRVDYSLASTSNSIYCDYAVALHRTALTYSEVIKPTQTAFVNALQLMRCRLHMRYHTNQDNTLNTHPDPRISSSRSSQLGCASIEFAHACSGASNMRRESAELSSKCQYFGSKTRRFDRIGPVQTR